MPRSTAAGVAGGLARPAAQFYIDSMYRLCLQRAFSARHFLRESDGPEGAPHAHAYRIEWELRAAELDARGYLVDLIEVEKSLEPDARALRGCAPERACRFRGPQPIA